MPYKDQVKQRAYQRDWMRSRRAAWFEENGPCQLCGSWQDLELDHIDPSTKVSHSVWSWRDQRRNEELAKCRPLCASCHKSKSLRERATGERNGSARLTPEKVRNIRASSRTCRDLAREYGVSFGVIGDIKRRDTWKHVI